MTELSILDLVHLCKNMKLLNLYSPAAVLGCNLGQDSATSSSMSGRPVSGWSAVLSHGAQPECLCSFGEG